MIIPYLYEDDVIITINNQMNLTSLNLFPNKLRNSTLNILYEIGYDIFLSKKKKLTGKYIYLFDIIGEKFNVKINYINVRQNSNSSDEHYLKLRNVMQNMVNEIDVFMMKQFDGDERGYLWTHEEIEICVIVPPPKIIPVYEKTLIKPFDEKIWMYSSISVVLTALVWRMFKKYGADESIGNFLFGLFAFFVGQSADIKV